NDPKIIQRDMGELRTAGALTDRPHVRSACLEAIVHQNVAPGVQLHPSGFETDSSGVGSAARGDQDVAAGNGGLARRRANQQVDTISGMTAHADDFRRSDDIDSFLGEDVHDFGRDIGVLVREKLSCVLQHSHVASEAAISLRKFEADVTAAYYDEMFRNTIEL